jgi:hypothetical protein
LRNARMERPRDHSLNVVAELRIRKMTMRIDNHQPRSFLSMRGNSGVVGFT